MKQVLLTIKVSLLLMIAIVLSGCEGLPGKIVRDIEQIPEYLNQQKSLIKKENNRLLELDTHKEADFLLQYATDENWQQFFEQANIALNSAQKLYDNQIKPLFEQDDPKDTNQVSKLMFEFNAQLKTSKKAALLMSHRITFLMSARENSSSIRLTATKNLAEMKRLQSLLMEKVNKASNTYSHKKADLNDRQEQLNQLVKQAIKSEFSIDTEYQKIESSSQKRVDYAAFADESKQVELFLKESNQVYFEVSKKIDELYQSYVKVLADQRIDYYIVVKRASWCEGEYCGNGSDYNYQPIKVDSLVFEEIEKSNISTIATIRRSWGSTKTKIQIKKNLWQALGLNSKQNWNRNHSDADFWIDNMYSNAYQKHIEIKNDKLTELPWVRVKEAQFWKNYEDLGMAILTKPYGYYESDALTDAQPVGMATIAKPTVKNNIATGSNQYGEWRYSNGNSFWHYYGMYRLFGSLVGPSRYGYNDWNGYYGRRRGFGYYGSNRQYGTFGSTTFSNNRYQNSDFARRNANTVYSARTGKKTSGSSSIRGANSFNRNRGPSSRGK